VLKWTSAKCFSLKYQKDARQNMYHVRSQNGGGKDHQKNDRDEFLVQKHEKVTLFHHIHVHTYGVT